MNNKEPEYAVCGNCTLKLVTIAYKRAPWFRAVREPLKLGMRILSKIHHVNPADYRVRTPACYNCVRFYKVALKEKSATFRWLHQYINPAFDFVIERIADQEEQKMAKQYAEVASQGKVTTNEAESWMRGMKKGL